MDDDMEEEEDAKIYESSSDEGADSLYDDTDHSSMTLQPPAP